MGHHTEKGDVTRLHASCLCVMLVHYLSKRTFSNERVDLVAVLPAFSWVHYVVVILIIVAVIDHQSLLLPSRQLCRLLFTSTLLCSHSLAVVVDLTYT